MNYFRSIKMIVGITGWIVLGLIAGFIASKFVNLRGDDPGLGIGLGAVGAVIGGWLYTAISGVGVSYFNTLSLFFAGVGAAAALATWHLVRRRYCTSSFGR
jgi:uncharacterized membrane protein YeaQ/YmgE (transglycosylase-associated protein family)